MAGDPGEAAGRLERGEGWPAVARALGMDGPGLVQAVAAVGLGPEGSEGPTLVQTRPGRPGLVRAVSEEAIAEVFPGSGRPARLALVAGLLQVLDAWEASHNAAQEADDTGDSATSTYWHLIAHRREPDPGNALYWARRVGRHPIFPDLGRLAGPIAAEDPGTARVVAGGSWDSAAFIDYCTRARAGSVARRLQRLEMARLLDASLDRMG